MEDFNSSIEDLVISELEWKNILKSIALRIGFLIISFNTLENKIIEILVDSISDCAFDDEKAYIFISEMNYASRVNALNKYFMFLIRTSSYNKMELANKCNTIINNLRKAGEVRNQYVHANWSEINKKNLVFIKKKVNKNGLIDIHKNIKPDDIKKDETFIDSVYDELDDFYGYFI